MDLHKEVTRIEKKRRDGERMAGQKKKEGKKEGKEGGRAAGRKRIRDVRLEEGRKNGPK